MSVDPAVWRAEWEGLCARLAGRFARVEPREQAQAFVRALLSPAGTRSCWQLAEAAGDDTPDRMQRLLARACWDHDGVRDDLRSWVVARLGGGGIGIVDETGDAKKGTRTGVTKPMIFINSRNEDGAYAASLLYDALTRRLDEDQVFKSNRHLITQLPSQPP